MTDYEDLLARLPLADKVRLLTGETAFTLYGNESIGLSPMALSDGPTGVRGLKFVGGKAVALFPNATLIASSWDDDVARQVGRMLAEEAKRQHIHVVLGPTINLHRSPLGGRLFEAYSEDPYLTGRTAAAYVQGMQAEGIGACLKHLVANESETLRNFMDSRVTERTLRELYLLPFEMAIEDAHAWSMMAAYNNVNGVTASAHQHVQNEIVKDEWDWDGLIMSDWFATKTTAESANGGLDLVMPGPEGPWGDRLVAAVESGRVTEAAVDDHVVRLLRLAERTGALQIDDGAPDAWPDDLPAPDSAVRAEQLRTIAAQGITVLTNNGVLPLAAGDGGEGQVAVVGRHALETVDMGGGSAQVNPPYQSTVAEGMTQLLGTRASVTDGVAFRQRPVPAKPGYVVDPRTGQPGMRVTLLAGDGTVVSDEYNQDTTTTVGWDDDLSQPPVKAVLTARIADDGAVSAAGTVRLGAIGAGDWTISCGDTSVDAELRFAGKDPGEAMIKPPAWAQDVQAGPGDLLEATVTLRMPDWAGELLADDALGLTEESHLLNMDAFGRLSLVAEPTPRTDDELLADAAAAAAQAEVAVVVVGLSEEQETESSDKETLALPGRQDELVAAVAQAAKRTVVVVNAATPVLMPWLDAVDAVLWAGLPGQEGGHAIAAALTGEIEPAGRLVTSFPAADGASPAWNVTPDGELALEYAEETAIGYRGFHAGLASEPLFWFGHGLGYSTWEYGEPAVQTDAGAPIVTVTVTNTGQRDSREVVQVYLDPAAESEPIRLAGYAGVDVQAGASATVTVACDARLWRSWDEKTSSWSALGGGQLVLARGLGDIRATVELS